MIKLIFLIVIGIVIFAFVGQPLSVYTTWFSEGLSNFIGATGLIFSVLGALTNNLFDYAFIRSVLIAGSFVFAVDYIIKLITGHHLEENEEETDEILAQPNYLEEKPKVQVITFKPQKDLYYNKQTYSKYHFRKVELSKRANARYEKSLNKQRKEQIKKLAKDELVEWREIQRKLKKGEL